MKLHLLLATTVASGLLLLACESQDALSTTVSQTAPGADASAASNPSDGSNSNADGAAPGAGLDGGAGANADSSALASPSVLFSGRFDATNAVSWSGAQIIANFSGTSVSVTLNETGTSYFDVMIDGKLTQTLALSLGTNTYVLASGLSEGTHTVELYRRSEAIYGITQFLGFDFGTGTLLATPNTFAHKLEFLGDSLTAGYGVECTSATQTNTAATQNEHKDFASLAAQTLNAEHINLGYSGTGVYWNYDRTDPQIYGLDYPLTHPAEPSASPAWNFSHYTPDLVWIMIGTNDWNEQSATDPPPPLSGFTSKYQDLVSFVRSQYPNAEIFLAIAPDTNDDYPAGYDVLTNMRAAVASIRSTQAGLGDNKIALFEFAAGDPDVDFTGCDGHPSPAKQVSMASEVVTAMKQTMGW